MSGKTFSHKKVRPTVTITSGKTFSRKKVRPNCHLTSGKTFHTRKFDRLSLMSGKTFCQQESSTDCPITSGKTFSARKLRPTVTVRRRRRRFHNKVHADCHICNEAKEFSHKKVRQTSP
ncbi:hypothetical protein AVEN_188641-1 [Araneus ventricosus]|uniref:Uncharacterized protein n=1 Tax=Araneus ventricosus TaxID=182803 RepID=A0A4Y2RY56_ARAVE|nr:hypothetical protein AVEN_188641-1 [Araneus ventricosus]